MKIIETRIELSINTNEVLFCRKFNHENNIMSSTPLLKLKNKNSLPPYANIFSMVLITCFEQIIGMQDINILDKTYEPGRDIRKSFFR